MFFRHGRFFVMAFVAQRCASVLERPGTDISTDEANQLSRATNEVAEIVYSISQSLQAAKGYLAIFRNLTDAQPLADRVIARLEEPDRTTPPPARVEVAVPVAQQGNAQ